MFFKKSFTILHPGSRGLWRSGPNSRSSMIIDKEFNGNQGTISKFQKFRETIGAHKQICELNKKVG